MFGSLEEGLPASAAALLDIQLPIDDLTGILGRTGDDLAIERRGFVRDDGDQWAIHHLTVSYTINCQYAVGVAGSSQFEVLAELSSDAGIPWGQITVSHLDEYVGLDPTHPASLRRFLHERFVDQLPMAPAAFHERNGQAADAAKECERLAGLVPAAPSGVAMIGIGENAHLAFNDPPADFVTEKPCLVVALAQRCRQQQVGEGWFPSLATVPTHAISMREDLADGPWIGDEGDQPDVAATVRALERELLTHPRQQFRPCNP